MIQIKGKYNSANIFQSVIDEATENQVKTILDQPFVENETIRIMPDCHAGAGCVIGTTMTINNGKVCPNLVGVDIGCGMYLMKLEGIKKSEIDFSALDSFIRKNIPSGLNVRDNKIVSYDNLKNLRCYRELKDGSRFEKAIGTLGGGNHFLEINEGKDGTLYFVVHTGSRNLGKQVAEYYQNLANELCNNDLASYFIEKANLIEQYKKEGRKTEIQGALIALKKKFSENKTEKVPKDLAYLEGSYLEDYLHDMDICQRYAHLNRETILRVVCKFFNLDFDSIEKFETIHNYIDLNQKILRKGSIDASKGKKVLIPINMRDGSIIAIGKGNEDYNCSAPHGAGRLMSRNEARASIDLKAFEQSMEGIYTTCINEQTIDESAFAYKSIENVLPWIEGTCDVVEIIKPIYNFKASE